MSQPLLDLELRHFASIRDALVARGHAGKWVCIVGERLVGIYGTPLDALDAGASAAGKGVPYLIDEIRPARVDGTVDVDKAARLDSQRMQM